MNKSLRFCGIIVCFMALHFYAFSQGIHFSQIDNVPLFLSPALAAQDKDIDYSLGGNYRDQETPNGSNYTTYNAWADLALQPAALNNSWIGIGALFAKDKVNTSFLDKTQGTLNLAFHQELNNDALLSLGTSFQYTLNAINPDNLIYEDQWNGLIYDRSIPSQDMVLTNTHSYSIGLGINYLKIVSDDFNFNIGASINNINRPKQNLIDNVGLSKTTLNNNNATTPFLYHFYAHSILRINEQWVNKSNAYFALQGMGMETILGSYLKYYTYPNSPIAILFGLSYRWDASMIGLVGLEVRKIQFMLSYEAGIQKTKNFVYYNNALELSAIMRLNFLRYERGSFSRNNRIRCKF